MNNKRGGVGAKILLVLILMIASAIGGAYGYRVLDGKMAVRDAQKYIERIDIADYDTPESETIRGYIDNTSKDLATAATRKEVYDIMDDFKLDVSKVMTKTEKELAEARKAVEEARNSNKNYNNNSNNNSYNNDSSNSSNSYDNYEEEDTADDNSSNNSSGGLFGNLFGSGNDSAEEDSNGL